MGYFTGIRAGFPPKGSLGKLNISIDNIEKLAHALGLTASDLLRKIRAQR